MPWWRRTRYAGGIGPWGGVLQEAEVVDRDDVGTVAAYAGEQDRIAAIDGDAHVGAEVGDRHARCELCRRHDQLKQAVGQAYERGTFVRDIRIEADGRPPLVVKIIPMVSDHGFAKVIAGRPATLLVFRDAPLDITRRLQYVGELYGLTTAERKVLAAVIDGADMKSVASRLDVSMATLKTHLTRIFSKTGTSQQKALISLVLKGADYTDR